MIFILVVLLFLLVPLFCELRISTGILPVFFTAKLKIYGITLLKIDIVQVDNELYIVNKLTKQKPLKIKKNDNNMNNAFTIRKIDAVVVTNTADYCVSSLAQSIKEHLMNLVYQSKFTLNYIQSYANDRTMVLVKIKFYTCILRIIVSYLASLLKKEEKQNV